MTLSPDKLERIYVFQDTQRRCHTLPTLTEAIRLSLAEQRFIGENDMLPATQPYTPQPPRIIVSQKRSFEAALGYRGKRVCVLNFASATHPGGGVLRGSNAQEECLCRCSTLYECLTAAPVREPFHQRHLAMLSDGTMTAMYNDDCIYTPGVVVFKSDTAVPQMLPENEWMKLDVLTCAAPRLETERSRDGSWTVQAYDAQRLKAIHIKRFSRIIGIAYANHAEVLILGAFGCGAFHNPPGIVATAAKEALASSSLCPETVEFAVYCTQRVMGNCEAFHRAFSGGLPAQQNGNR